MLVVLVISLVALILIAISRAGVWSEALWLGCVLLAVAVLVMAWLASGLHA